MTSSKSGASELGLMPTITFRYLGRCLEPPAATSPWQTPHRLKKLRALVPAKIPRAG